MNRYYLNNLILKGFYKDNYYNRLLNRQNLPYGKDLNKELFNDTTDKKYKDKQNNYTLSRVENVHNKIKNSLLVNKKSNKKPEVILLLGGPGSGKSYVYEQTTSIKDKKNFNYLNSDDVKFMLPEYKKFIKEHFQSAASRVHEESSDIIKDTINECIDNKYNFVLDGTLSNTKKAIKLIDRLKNKGYKIKIKAVIVNVNKAWYSAQKRGYTKKRFVSKDIVVNGNIGSRKTLKVLLENKMYDEYEIIDNNKLNKKQPFKILKHEIK